MALIIRCSVCDDVLEDSTDHYLAEALEELRDVGVEIVGDPNDPDQIICAECVRRRAGVG